MDLKKIQKIIILLKKKKWKVSFVESCTGGMISSAITSVSGSSKIFDMGFITYSNEAKNKVLKIPSKIIKKNGAVSAECCLSMVNNLSKISKSRICVSTTGIAGPSGGTKNKPVGLVYIGIKNKGKVKVIKCLFKNNGRAFIRKAALKKTINLILEFI